MIEGEGAHYAHGEEIVLVTSFGVGWASPSITEMIEDESTRPAVGIGAMGVIMHDGKLMNVQVAMTSPWVGLAQLAGQIDALREKLPAEFTERWRQEYDASRAYAWANLDSLDINGAPE